MRFFKRLSRRARGRVTVSVVIPVKDGERYLEELLEALRREGAEEILVIDCGSRDRSLEIARAAGVELLEIDPSSFAHGATRNLGAERTSGELLCFLTQDATPVPGWLAAYREAFALDERVGAAYGPHLPRPDTSPMIARELGEFFRSFSPDGGPVVQRAGDPSFLSNVNACYLRGCWEEIRFREVAYSEDQAFGTDMLAAGWAKVYQPGAAVLHAHDYGPLEFMRRYFDEYRGLRETTGHVEPLPLLGTARHVASQVAGDSRWMAEQGVERTRAGALDGALGRAPRRAARVLRARVASRETAGPARRAALARGPRRRGAEAERRRSRGRRGALAAAARGRRSRGCSRNEVYDVVEQVWRDGPAPLVEPVPGMAERERLRLAMAIPPFSRGSGGHNTLFQIFTRLERRGHVCSVWVVDYYGYAREVWPAVLRDEIREYFAPFEGPVYKGFDEWQGADVAIATGWQTVHALLRADRLPRPRVRRQRPRARVLLVLDRAAC